MVANVDTRRETAQLIGSDKVEGTAVYGADQQKIGSVQRVMIDKVSGRSPMPWCRSAVFWEWVKSSTTITRHPFGTSDAVIEGHRLWYE